MNRRSFFKGLGIAALAGPKIAQALAAREWKDPPKTKTIKASSCELTAEDINRVMAEQCEQLRIDVIRHMAQSDPWADLVQ